MFIEILNNVQGSIGPVTWDANGIPNFASQVLSSSMSVPDNMKFIFQLVQNTNGYGITQDVITKINSVLPSSVSPFASTQDYQTRIETAPSPGASPDPTVVFAWKYIMVGPAYLSWVAQNKYKLDPNFVCFNASPSSVPSPSPSG
jgi:hypothetical protein